MIALHSIPLLRAHAVVLQRVRSSPLGRDASPAPCSQADVTFANTVDASVVAFNSALPPKVEALAHKEGVIVQTHDVIYRLVEARAMYSSG